ncbi:DUF7439 family protein [Streptomyces smyrnaeus]|uniref:DUF7439 family protein n=1 Tax=Streptomyces smyrnaeus TaxID=1387713 RepID=UPI003F4C91E4
MAMKSPLLLLLPARLKPYAKAVVATVGALATIATTYCADVPEVAAALSVLTALGVVAQRNEKPTRGELIDSVEDAAGAVRDALKR